MIRLLFLLTVVFAACNPYPRLQKRAPRTQDDTLALATACTNCFPVVPRFDTLVRWDTVPVLDESRTSALQAVLSAALTELDICIAKSGKPVNLDSLRGAVAASVRKDFRSKVIRQTIEITKTVPDSAAVAKWRILFEQERRTTDVQSGKIEAKKEEISELKKRLRRRGIILWAIISAILGIIVIRIFKPRIPFIS